MEWILANGPFVVLGLFVLLQWIAFQVLIVHYYYFRKNLKRPRPDGIRLSLLEKNVALQSEQIEMAFTKLAEISRDLSRRSSAPSSSGPSARENPSVEATVVSLGELNLKKRILELARDSKTTSVSQ